jgi:hypothetical protein
MQYTELSGAIYLSSTFVILDSGLQPGVSVSPGARQDIFVD